MDRNLYNYLIYRKIKMVIVFGGGVMLCIGQNKAKNIWCFDENFVSLQIELITI